MRLTKSELRDQERRMTQLQRYLPTLQLKKAMLQAEINVIRHEIDQLRTHARHVRDEVEEFVALLGGRLPLPLDAMLAIDRVNKRYENIAGVEVPYFEGVDFRPAHYSLLETPAWVDSALLRLQELAVAKVEVDVAEERKSALEKELRDVSIRVNLFEKRLIPTAQANIRKIKVFLGDQELAAVARAKVAKTKIEERRAQHHAH